MKTSDKFKELFRRFNKHLSADGRIIHSAFELIKEVEQLEKYQERELSLIKEINALERDKKYLEDQLKHSHEFIHQLKVELEENMGINFWKENKWI
jgi:uncharacterized protein Yka (UPF0111/DUF47 family)